MRHSKTHIWTVPVCMLAALSQTPAYFLSWTVHCVWASLELPLRLQPTCLSWRVVMDCRPRHWYRVGEAVGESQKPRA